MNLLNRDVIVIAPHPDDEWWGVGGTLLRLRDLGSTIRIIMVTNGGEHGRVRCHDSYQLAKELNFSWLFWGLKTNEVHLEMGRLIGLLDDYITDSSLIFIPYRFDIHQDHRAVHQASMAAIRRKRHCIVCSIESLYKQQFQPNFYIDISEYMSKKIRYYNQYYTREIDRIPDLLPIRLVSKNLDRGYESGYSYAEAFVIEYMAM